MDRKESDLEKKRETRPAVEHPVVNTYEKERTFLRGIYSDRFDLQNVWESLRDPEKRVIRGSEIPLSTKTDRLEGSQLWGKSYVRPWRGVTQSLDMHKVVLAPEAKSKAHGHQSEALMFILEGEGYEIHDGVEYQWEEGDLVVIHGGCVHQHYSEDPDDPCKALIVKGKPVYKMLHLIYEGTVEDTPNKPARFADWTPDELYSEVNKREHDKEGDE